ncbi:hypothetical protein IG631_10771 [Alternaria alternata]|nr:hypothetical protein IG631_10771 [Alternaria alternata]
MPLVHSYVSSTACGIVFCRIEEIVAKTDISEQSSEESEAEEGLERSMHEPKSWVEELGVDDILKDIRKFRRIRLINRSIGTYCKLCEKINTKMRRRTAEVDRIGRWQREPHKFGASIEKSMEMIRSLDGEINELSCERNSRLQAIHWPRNGCNYRCGCNE